jgi:hypothetical protein
MTGVAGLSGRERIESVLIRVDVLLVGDWCGGKSGSPLVQGGKSSVLLVPGWNGFWCGL